MPEPPSPLDGFRLGLAFMASAPRGQHELDFEAEEAAILTAVGQTRIDLMVEDTGDPEQLGRRLAEPGGMPVVHLSWKSTLTRRCSRPGRRNAASHRPVLALNLADHQPPCTHFTGLPDGR